MSNVVELTLLGNDKASSVINGVSGAVRSLIGQALALAGVTGAGLGIGALVKQGVEFNKTMEDSKGGIAGVLLMTRQYVDATGKVVTGQGAMNAAFSEASKIQEKLKKDALGTAASYTELVGAFQTALAPAAAAGVTNLDDVREITVMATQAMAALNIPTAQAAQELRGLFAGDAGPDNRLNQILRVTKADLEGVKGNTEAAAKLFKDRLGPAASAAAMQTGTLTVRLSNLGDILDQTMGEATSGLFKGISDAIASVSSGVGASSEKFKAIGADISAAFTSVMALVKEMAPAVLDLVGAVVEQLPKAAEALRALPLKEILGIITDLIEATDGWALAIVGAVHAFGGLKATGVMLATIPGHFHAASLALDGMALRINAATGASIGLSQALSAAFAAGVFAAAIWGIGKIIEGLHTVAELSRERKLDMEAQKGTGDAIIRQLDNFKTSFEALEGPLTSSQQWTMVAMRGMQDMVRADLASTGQVAEETRTAYMDLLKQIKATNPNIKESPLGSVAKAVSAETKAAMDSYAALSAKLAQKAELSGLDGIKLKLREIQLAAEAANKEISEKAAAAGASFAQVWKDRANVAKVAAEETSKALRDLTKGFVAEPAQLWAWDVKKQLDQVKSYAAKTGEQTKEELDAIWTDITTNDTINGALGGWEAAIAAIPSQWQSAYRASQDIWRAMGQSFDQLFVSVFTGKLDRIGDVFRGFADSMAGTFASLVTDMVQRWLAGTKTIGEGFKSLQESMGGTGGVLMGAGVGYGVGGMTGQGTQANQIGGAIGGAIGTIILPVIGTVIGAIVGGLIGELFNRNTLMHSTGSIGGMVGASRYDWVPPQTIGPGGRPLKPGTPGDGGDYETIPGYWKATTETAKSVMELAGKRVFDGIEASLAGLFKLAGGDGAKGFLEIYRSSLKESLSGANFDINAGSKEDIQKVSEFFLGTFLPRVALSAAFGQTGYLPPGHQDASGGIGNLSYGMPGMNPDGTWQGDPKLFDENAAIPKFLLGLGFSVKKVEELAARISTDDPQKLLEYITGIVGVVVGLKKLGGEMGKTFEQLKAGWSEEAAAGPAAAFGKKSTELAGLFDNLDLYSGDEQLKKAQEAQAASEQFWQSVLSYLQQLDALQQKLSASIQGQRAQMDDFLNPKTDAQKIAGAQQTIDETWGKLINAKTPAAVEAAATAAQQAIDTIFAIMAERINRGKALLQTIGGIIDKLGSLSADVAFAQLEQTNPLEAWGQEMVKIQQKISDASKLSGIDQIAALEDVGASAEEMYQNLSGFLADVANASKAISQSINSQIWELGVGEMDPSGKASAITQRIQELQAQLKLATSPAEIQAITSEIQSLTGRYIGQFAQDDPNRQAAIDWARQMLGDTNAIAQEALRKLGAGAEEFGHRLETMLEGSTTTISGNIDAAAAEIAKLSFTLGELDRTMGEAIGRLGTAALDSLGPLREAMNGAATIFTNATGSAAAGLTGEEGFNASVDRSAAHVDTFTEAIDRAVSNLNRLATAGGGTASPSVDARQTAPPPSQARVSARAVIPLVRRFSGSLTPRVA